MDAYNIKLTNMVYQGGDDCIAVKPRSYNIFVQNVSILPAPIPRYLLTESRSPATAEMVLQ
jgi:hypothetical protein